MAATDALARKYRPQNWDEVFGNEALVSMIKQKLEDDALPHTILLHGSRGCAKTTIARLIAKSLGCTESNIFEYNIGKNRKVDEMEDILNTIYLSPIVERGSKKLKVYILDEFHMATSHAQNALLKDSEEPPDFVYFILCSTEPKKILDTIHSRCAQYEVKPLQAREMNEFLDCILEAEGKEISRKVQSRITINSKGIPRNALMMLETIIDIKDESLALDLVESGLEDVNILEICRILVKGGSDLWKSIASLIDRLKQDSEECRLGILGYLAKVACNDPSKAQRMWLIADAFSTPCHYGGKSQLIFQIINACIAAQQK